MPISDLSRSAARTHYFVEPHRGKDSGNGIFYGVIVGFLAFFAILAAIVIPSDPYPEDRATDVIVFAIVVLGSVVLGLAIGFGMVTVNRTRIRKVERATPESLVTTSASTDGLRNALISMNIKPSLIFGRFCLAMNSSSLEIWTRRTESGPMLRVPWSQVVSVTPGRARVGTGRGSASFRAAIVVVKGPQGPVTLPLPFASPSGFRAARSWYANVILSDTARYTSVATETNVP